MQTAKPETAYGGNARTRVPLLVIGAGPYGLATAACAKGAGIGQLVVGEPMAFWRESMPAGMFLRSSPDWHLDSAGVHTFAAYLNERGVDPAEVDPIPIALFLDYAGWFEERAGIEVLPDLVRDLSKPDGRFEATPWSPPPASPASRSSRGGSSEVCRRGAGRTPATWSGSTSFAESGY